MAGALRDNPEALRGVRQRRVGAQAFTASKGYEREAYGPRREPDVAAFVASGEPISRVGRSHRSA